MDFFETMRGVSKTLGRVFLNRVERPAREYI